MRVQVGYFGSLTMSLFLQVLFSDIGYAQENSTLNEVVVTASRFEQKQSDLGKVIDVITSAQLAKSQGRTLPEILNTVAGLNIGGNAIAMGEPKSLFLRGASGAYTLILIDGVAMNNASGITGEYDISSVPLEIIQRIEIVKGGNSTLYGSGAVAGVINIITQKGYQQQLQISLLGTAGSYDTYKQVITCSGQLRSTSFSFAGSNLNSGGFSTAVAPSKDQHFNNDGLAQQAMGLRLTEQLNERLILRGSFQVNKQVNSFDFGAFQDALDNTASKTSYLAGVGASFKIFPGEFVINFSQNLSNNSFSDLKSRLYSRIRQAEASLVMPLMKRVTLSSGLNYSHAATDQESIYNKFDAQHTIFSAFASCFFKSEDGFRSEVGARLTHHNQYGINWSYTLNPSYLFADRYKIFANLSSAFRTPSLYQLFAPNVGNVFLRPEQALSWEAGFDVQILKEQLGVRFSYFNRKIGNLIDYKLINATTGVYRNLNKQQDHGFELEAKVKPYHGVQLNISYAYVNGHLITPDDVEFDNLTRRPKNTIGANLELSFLKKITGNLRYKFMGQRNDLDFRSYPAEVVNLSAAHIVDMYVQFQPQKRFTLFADLKNIFDRNYVEIIGYTTKGFNFTTGLKFEFKK